MFWAALSLVVGVLGACAGLAGALVAVAIPAFVVWKMHRAGVFDPETWNRLLVFQPVSLPKPTGAGFVKRATCRSCGSPKVKPSLNAYVYCDFCGELTDWDFRAAMSDRRSRAPGPAYEGLLARHRATLERARAAGDRATYLEIQRELWGSYVDACPAAMSPRIGDPRYRERIVAYQAELQTEADLDPAVKSCLDRQQEEVGRLTWDRSNPFQPRVGSESFARLTEAVLETQRAYTEKAETTGLLARHPDRPTGEMLLRVGVSALVQGWMPYLAKDDADRLLRRTGLDGEYVAFTPIEEIGGACDGCGAHIDAPKGAKRVLCHHCGAYVAVGGGAMPCHGCAAPIEIAPGVAVFACGSCGARVSRLQTG